MGMVYFGLPGYTHGVMVLALYCASAWQWLLGISSSRSLKNSLEEFYFKVDKTNTTLQLFFKKYAIH